MVGFAVLVGLVVGVLGAFGWMVARGNEGKETGVQIALFCLFVVLLSIALGGVLVSKEMDHARLTLYRAAAGYEVSAKDRQNAVEALGEAKDFEAVTLKGLPPVPQPNQPWREWREWREGR